MPEAVKFRNSVSDSLLPWNRRDLYAMVGLVAFWLYKCSVIMADFSQRHFAMRLTVPDLFMEFWSTFWLGRVARGMAESIHHSPLLNYPIGANYFGARPNYLHCMVAGWFHIRWGGVFAANLVALGAILFSLFAFYVLFRRLAGSRLVGIVLSIVVASYSLLFDNQLLDISLCNAGFLALSLHFWLRTIDKPHWRTAVFATIFGLLTGVSHLYYLAILIGMMLLAVPFLAHAEFRSKAGPRHSTLWAVGVLVAIGGLVMVALWGPMATIRAVSASGSVDPQIVPRNFTRPEFLMYCLALAALIGGGWSLRKKVGRSGLFWTVCAILLFVFSLSDRTFVSLQAIGRLYPIPELPLTELLRHIPFGWRFTQPDRLVVGSLISAGCLAAVLYRGFARTEFPLFRTSVSKAFVFLAAVCIVMPALGVSTPYRMTSAIFSLTTSGGRFPISAADQTASHPTCVSGMGRQGFRVAGVPVLERYIWPFLPLEYFVMPAVPKVLADLADDPEPMAIMEVGEVRFMSVYLQTFHGKGNGGFQQPEHLRGSTPYSALTIAEEEIQKDENYDSLSLSRLKAMDVRYVIRFEGDNPDALGPWCPSPELLVPAMEALSAPHLQLVHDDGVIKVWKVDRAYSPPDD